MAEPTGLTPGEVLKKAQSKYISFLKSCLRNENPFPLQLRGCSINGSIPFAKRMDLIKKLSQKKKTSNTAGYNLILERKTTRSEGSQTFLKSIEFPTPEDYIGYLGKQNEFSRFLTQVEQIRQSLPELEEWLQDNPKKILKSLEKWDSLVEVVRYFRDEENPSASMRELSISVPTKFIEQNQSILREIIDQVIPEHRIQRDQKNIALRYGLDKDDDFRFRMVLPNTLSSDFPFRDIAILPSEMSLWNPDLSNVIVIENKYSFLSLDLPGDWLKIWGAGNSVIRLKSWQWLKNKNLFYWGDLDPQGFEILHLLRTAFPLTQSLCMELEDYNQFKEFAHSAGNYHERKDLLLTPKEEKCYQHLISNPDASRIEQERISLNRVLQKISPNGRHF